LPTVDCGIPLLPCRHDEGTCSAAFPRISSFNADKERSWKERMAWSGLKRLVEEQDRTRLLLFLEGQSRVLEMVACSVPLGTVLEELMRVLEEQVDDMACSVLLVSEDGKHLRDGAAPSLPESYRRAIDGLPIGVAAGSCGTAAHLGRPVIVSDIARDPLWRDYKQLALDIGFQSCWSTPIVSGQGELLGTFAMYHRRPFSPSSVHFALIDLATHLARIAIERANAEREHQRLQDAKDFADRYRMVLAATGEAVWDWEVESGAVLWNGGWTAFGYGGEHQRRTVDWWIERIHPEDTERVRRSFEQAVDSGQLHWEEEYRFRRMDGTFADVVDRGLVVRDAAGKAVRMVGALQDITRRKRHEQETQQLAERFRSATVAAAVGTWRADLTTKLFHADESLNLMLGKKAEEIVLTYGDVIRAVHPDDRTRVAQAIEDAIATGRPYQCDHRVVLPDGEVRWLRSRGRVLYDVHGRPQGMTGAMADFTELKHAEQSMAILADASRLLAESLDLEQILSTITRMVVPSFADAVVMHQMDSETGQLHPAAIHAANPELLEAGRALMGTGSFRVAAPSRRVARSGRAEYIARLTPEWILSQDVDENLASLIRRFGISSTIHVPIVRAEKPIGVIVFAATGTRVYNERDLAFAEELARRASNAMRNADLFQTARAERTRAEEAAALREQLVAIVGHDLRNPLTSIIMGTQLLGSSALPDAEAKIVDRIESSATRMMRLIGLILDFARIRAGLSFDLQLESADLHSICNAVIDELRLSSREREIVLSVEGDGEVMGDPDRIAQMLSNLIGNAIQHGTRGPVHVTVRDAPPDAVAIAIHSFGPPIPKEAQGRIFDAFRREKRAKGRSTSIGLGLFIANQIALAHGGWIAVQSPDRDGTTFTVTLPRKTAALHPHERGTGADAEI
jgi:PAS domain S-box-containing protein